MAQGLTEEGFRKLVLEAFPQKDVDIRTYSPLALAFLGDAVYSLIARTMVVSKGNRQAEKLHNETKHLVSAHAQAMIGDAIQDLLTEEEIRIYKRGHNSNPYHHAKNQSLDDYLKATALETLCGYLYLQDKTDRFLELMKEGIQRTQTGEEKNA
jgi:ribonuclease-3 family protein